MSELMSYLPEYYRKSKVMGSIQDVNKIELDRINNKYNDLVNQCNVNTATWGLELWEREYNIKINSVMSYEERRAVINANMLSHGTCTINLIKQMANSFTGGDVEIREDVATYTFTIKFVGVKGIPKNLDYFSSVLDNIKPAHLNYKYEFTYNSWEYIQSKKYTWNDLKFMPWNTVQVLK